MKSADEAGNISGMSNVISGLIADATPPTIDSLSVDPSTVWPSNHKMVQVVVNAISSDNCDSEPLCEILSVESNEPANGLGD